MMLLARTHATTRRLSPFGAAIQNLASGRTEDRYLPKNDESVGDKLDQIFSTWGL